MRRLFRAVVWLVLAVLLLAIVTLPGFRLWAAMRETNSP